MTEYHQSPVNVRECSTLRGWERASPYNTRLIRKILATNDLDATEEDFGPVVEVIASTMTSLVRSAIFDDDVNQLHALIEVLVPFAGPDCLERGR